jgi:hypothetical protein
VISTGDSECSEGVVAIHAGRLIDTCQGNALNHEVLCGFTRTGFIVEANRGVGREPVL